MGAFNINLTVDIDRDDDLTAVIYLKIIKRMQVPLDVTLTFNASLFGFHLTRIVIFRTGYFEFYTWYSNI